MDRIGSSIILNQIMSCFVSVPDLLMINHLLTFLKQLLTLYKKLGAVLLLNQYFTDLCSSFLDHFQLALVDLYAPEEAIKEPKENPSRQPEKKKRTFIHIECTIL